MPDDVIENGERLMSVMDEFRDSKGGPLAFQKVVLDALATAVAAAIKEWGEAEAADATYQQSFAEMRA